VAVGAVSRNETALWLLASVGCFGLGWWLRADSNACFFFLAAMRASYYAGGGR
jgi:hypothetical protein